MRKFKNLFIFLLLQQGFLSHGSSDISSLLNAVDEIDKRILQLREEEKQTSAELELNEKELKRLKGLRDNLHLKMFVWKKKFLKILPFLLHLKENGNVAEILLLFGIGDFNELRMTLFHLNYASQKLMELYKSGKEEMEELVSLEKSIEEVKSAQEKNIEEYKKMLVELEELRKNKIEEIERLKKYEREERVDIYSKLSGDVEGMNLMGGRGRGEINWKSMENPLKGGIEKIEERGGGFLIKTQGETEVHAPDSGYVTFTGWIRGFGHVIIIKTQNEIYFVFAHLGQVFVSTGDNVKKGDVIGLTGGTGIVDAPSLYIEMRKGNERIPPGHLKELFSLR